MQLSRWADVATFEFENVPARVVEALAEHTRVHPSVTALATAQDRLKEKQAFRQLDIPTPAYAAVDNMEGLRRAAAQLGLPVVLKTRTEGYDGKGQAVLRDVADLMPAWQRLGGAPMILEALVPFRRELSIIAVRNAEGEVRFYPLNENHHRKGILRLSLSLDSDPWQARAEAYMGRLLRHLDYVGTLALELFQTDAGLLANEIAPRVHNTGHWTIEGTRSSQFENHLRAIAGLTLGDTGLSRPAAMVNLIGRLPSLDAIAEVPGTTPHIYGKAERPGRKLGHVTLTGGEGGFDAGFRHRLARLPCLAGEDALAAEMEEPAAA